jgi:Flp pilus assembly protein TadG
MNNPFQFLSEGFANRAERTRSKQVRPPVRPRTRGSAIVEFALVSPLMFLFMVASFDFGLYTYAFLAVQNGVRVAALHNSAGIDSAADQATACAMVLEELRGLPNTGSASGCNGSPVTVSSVLLCPSNCSAGTGSADGKPAALVTVKYKMPGVFQLHLPGSDTITRTAQMRVRSIQ